MSVLQLLGALLFVPLGLTFIHYYHLLSLNIIRNGYSKTRISRLLELYIFYCILIIGLILIFK